MKITIAYWNLDNSNQTIEILRDHLHEEGVDAWKAVQGMQFKCWISDQKNNLWGAVMIWKSNEKMNQPLPPNRATELIGYPPQFRVVFDVEASVLNSFDLAP